MIHTTRICDRCGARQAPASEGKPLPLPTILPVTATGLPEPVEADLCQTCAAIVLSAIRGVLARKPSADLLKLE